jgi:hypothetical protein
MHVIVSRICQAGIICAIYIRADQGDLKAQNIFNLCPT